MGTQSVMPGPSSGELPCKEPGLELVVWEGGRVLSKPRAAEAPVAPEPPEQGGWGGSEFGTQSQAHNLPSSSPWVCSQEGP